MGGPSTQIHLKCAVNKIEKKKDYPFSGGRHRRNENMIVNHSFKCNKTRETLYTLQSINRFSRHNNLLPVA